MTVSFLFRAQIPLAVAVKADELCFKDHTKNIVHNPWETKAAAERGDSRLISFTYLQLPAAAVYYWAELSTGDSVMIPVAATVASTLIF